MTTLTLQNPAASTNLSRERARRSPARTFALWLLQIGAAAIFLAAGLSKLASATAMSITAASASAPKDASPGTSNIKAPVTSIEPVT